VGSGARNAGDITLRVAKDLSITGGGSITTHGSPDGASGNIAITTGDTVAISGTGQLDTETTSRIESTNESGGTSGTVEIRTGKFLLAGNAIVQTGSEAQGGGGITIHANDSVTVSDGSRIRMFVVAAPGGLVDISADNTINIDHASIRTRTGGPGDAGAIALSAKTITVTGGQVTSDSAGGSGHGGDVTIFTTQKFAATGQFTDEFGETSPAGVFSQAHSSGDGGTISLTSPSVEITNGAQISSSAFQAGNAGAIVLNTGDVLLSAGGQLSSSSSFFAPGLIPTGAAGTITIQGLASPAESGVIGGGGSGISTETQGAGAGGNIRIAANSVRLQDGGALSAATSGTAASATGGMITVNAKTVGLSNGAIITADTSGPAPAGDIIFNVHTLRSNVNSEGLPVDGAAMVNITSRSTDQREQGGRAGSVTISGLSTDPAALVAMDNTTIQTSILGGAGETIPAAPRILV